MSNDCELYINQVVYHFCHSWPAPLQNNWHYFFKKDVSEWKYISPLSHGLLVSLCVLIHLQPCCNKFYLSITDMAFTKLQFSVVDFIYFSISLWEIFHFIIYIMKSVICFVNWSFHVSRIKTLSRQHAIKHTFLSIILVTAKCIPH